jgi:diaminopimelate epimerase
MPEIPFVKAHGAGNDFLLTWRNDAASLDDLPSAARAICARHTGIGADGWLLVDPHAGSADASIVLYNSDGSVPELSGNGTRCAAAWLIHSGAAPKPDLHIATGAGVKSLRLISREANHFEFEMNMGTPQLAAGGLHARLALGPRTVEAVLVNVGNPQCVVLCDEFPADWRELGAALEHHPHFPLRTNVSFVRVLDEHTIDVLFWERGAGETQSSGTGSTGAAAAAILRGAATSPVTVQTPAGPLRFRWDGEASLLGPAEITARGVFFL